MEITLKRYLSSPRWGGLICGGFFLAFAYILYYEWQYGDYPGHIDDSNVAVHGSLGLLCFVYHILHHSILPKGIGLHLFGVPVGLIKWENVEMAEYVYCWHFFAANTSSEVKQQGIFVMFKNCREFYDPHGDSLIFFLFKHPFSCAFIRFPKYKRRKVVELFQKYYPDLKFQIGCDTSFLNEEVR